MHPTNRRRSWREIRLSSTRARMCSQTGRGRLENRIFGNGVLPEDGPDQILTSLALALGIGLSHETAISRVEILPCRSFSLRSALREHNQCPAHRKMLFSGHTLDLNCQLRWYGDALADGWMVTFDYAPLRDFSCPMISSAPAWCTSRPQRALCPCSPHCPGPTRIARTFRVSRHLYYWGLGSGGCT